MPDEKNGEPIVPFATPKGFGTWLRKHHANTKGVWLKLAKKDSKVPSVTYAEALDEALCWGWIDGVKAALDEVWWLQRFTPRGPRSIWSKVNREKVAALEASGRMQAAGRAAVERAKANGQWDAAYDSPKNAKPSEDLLAALAKKPKALKFFEQLSSANRFAIVHRVHTAKKPETRAKRIAQFVKLCAQGKTIH